MGKMCTEEEEKNEGEKEYGPGDESNQKTKINEWDETHTWGIMLSWRLESTLAGRINRYRNDGGRRYKRIRSRHRRSVMNKNSCRSSRGRRRRGRSCSIEVAGMMIQMMIIFLLLALLCEVYVIYPFHSMYIHTYTRLGWSTKGMSSWWDMKWACIFISKLSLDSRLWNRRCQTFENHGVY